MRVIRAVLLTCIATWSFASFAAPPADSQPATAPATAPASASPQLIRNPVEFAKGIPTALVPASGKWTPLQIDAVNAELAKFKQRDVSLTLTASDKPVQKLDQPIERCHHAFLPNPTVLGRVTIAPVVYISENLKPQFAAINPRDVLRVNASISNVTLWSVTPTMVVKVELVNPTLVHGNARAADSQPATAANEAPITELAELIKAVPEAFVPKGDWTTFKLDEANAALAKFAGRPADLVMTVGAADYDPEGKPALTSTLVSVGRVLIRQRVYFPQSMELDVAALNAKDSRRIKATIKNVSLKELDPPARGKVGLLVELANPTAMELPPSAKPRPAASTRPTIPQGVIKDVGEFFRAIPPGVIPANAGGWTTLKKRAVDNELQQFRGREIALTLTLAAITGGEAVAPDRKNPYVLTAKPFESGRVRILPRLIVGDDMKLKFAAFGIGAAMRVNATIDEIRLENEGVALTLKPTAVEK